MAQKHATKWTMTQNVRITAVKSPEVGCTSIGVVACLRRLFRRDSGAAKKFIGRVAAGSTCLMI
jgi:hypothetical protein